MTHIFEKKKSKNETIKKKGKRKEGKKKKKKKTKQEKYSKKKNRGPKKKSDFVFTHCSPLKVKEKTEHGSGARFLIVASA